MFVIARAGQIGSETMEIMPIVPGGIGGIVGLLMVVQLLNGLLSAGETSVTLLRPVHVRHLRERGDKRGVRLQSLLDRQNLASAACQLGSRLAWAFIFLGAFLLAPYLMNAIGPSINVEPDNFGSSLLGAAAMIEAVPHLGAIDAVPENAWTPVARGDMAGGDFAGAVRDHYLVNPIARASAVMADLTRLASDRTRPLAAE